MKELGDAKYLSRYDSGDRNYCGRGWMMTTWLENYQDLQKVLGIDLVTSPELLQQYPAAALSAGYYWQSRGCGAAAQKDNLVGVTKVINGGLSHLSDRLKYLTRAKAIYGISEGPGGHGQADRQLRSPRAAR